jgi:Tol biopolymer transport system component/DNA-binding winged helix-turn-helix (wHTH) protein
MTAKNGEELRGGMPAGGRGGVSISPERRFGSFVLDLRGRALYHEGTRVHLTPKPFDTLALLVEGGGRTLSKRELLETVWAETAVTDDVLVQAIREIRRVLGDDKDAPRYVLTVPREGYRFVGALEAETLEPPSAETPGAAPHVPEPRRTRRTWILGVAGILLAASAALLLIGRRPRSAALPDAVPAATSGLRLLTSGPMSAVKPTFSPDGKYIAFTASTAESEGALDLYVLQRDGELPLQVTRGFDPAGDHPTFTPDGSHIVFSRYRSGAEGTRLPDLWIVPVLGGQPRIFLTEASGARFSPDGSRVAYTRYDGTRRPLRISPVARLQEFVEASDAGFMPRWSRDGKWIAYSDGDPNQGEGHLILLSTSLSERRQLTAEPTVSYGLAWAADSLSVIAAQRHDGATELWEVPISGAPARRLTSGVGGYSSPDVSPDGNLLVFAHGDGGLNLRVAESPESPQLRRITENESHAWIRFSPSGRSIASVRRRNPVDRLVVTDLETGVSRLVAESVARYPSWIDERSIAYLAPGTTPEATVVRVVRLDTGEDRPWTEFAGPAAWLDVTPDRGRAAVVLRNEKGGQKLIVRDFRLGRDVVVAEGASYESVRWLPGGTALSWSGPLVSSDARSSGVWMARVGEGLPTRILADGYGPVWSADGGTVFFSRMGSPAGLWRHRLEDHTTTRVREWVRVSGHDLWDGRRLAFLKQTSSISRIYTMPLHESVATPPPP